MKKWGVGLALVLIVFSTISGIRHNRRIARQIAEAEPELRIPVFVLHRVLPDQATEYIISPDKLRQLIQELKKRGYTPITLVQLDRALRQGGPLPPRPAMLTFDDAYLDNYLHALPVLQSEGWPAVFFAPVSKITDPPDERIEWGDGPEPVAMYWSELRDMKKAGMEIGSHALTHINLAKADPETVMHELTESRRILERELGEAPIALAYPGGRQSRAVRKIAAEAGYTMAFLSTWGEIKLPPDKIHALPRVHVPGHVNIPAFAEALLGPVK